MIKNLTLMIVLVFVQAIGFAQSYKNPDTLLLQLAKAKDDTSRVNTMNMLGVFYWAYKNDSALLFAQEALELARQIKFPKGESNALNLPGLINNTLGDSPAALQLFFKGLDVAEKNNINDETKANNIYNTGYSYLDAKDYTKAVSYLFRAKNLYNSLYDHFMKQLTEKDLGQTYLQMNRLDSAMKYGQQAYDDMNRFHGERTYTLNEFALIQTKNGNAQLALEYFRQSLADSINGNNYAENSRSYFGIAKVYQQLNKPDSCIYYAQKALNKAQQGKFYKNIIKASSLLAEIYNQKDFQKAFPYSKIAIDAKDSLDITGKRNAFRNITNFNHNDINKLADEYLRLAYHGLRAKDKSFNVSLKIDFDETIGNINILPQDSGRVLLNLINNSFYAVEQRQKAESKEYEPTVSVSTKKLDDRVGIKVADNGGGIPQKIVDKIFQPFFTTKPAGQGTGLGLSLSYDIVKAHGGELKVETKEGQGTTFIIELPNAV